MLMRRVMRGRKIIVDPGKLRHFFSSNRLHLNLLVGLVWDFFLAPINFYIK